MGIAAVLDDGVTSAKLFIELYGWFILIGAGICFFLWRKYGSSYVRANTSANANNWEHKKFDTSEVVKRQEQMELARLKLQEKYNAAAAAAAEENARKQQEIEEKRLAAKLEEWENHKQGKGYRNKSHLDEKPDVPTNVLKKDGKKTLRGNDYNPLMGGSDQCSIRPGRRGFGGAGGG